MGSAPWTPAGGAQAPIIGSRSRARALAVFPFSPFAPTSNNLPPALPLCLG